jgi:hypothetical protein
MHQLSIDQPLPLNEMPTPDWAFTNLDCPSPENRIVVQMWKLDRGMNGYRAETIGKLQL